MSLFSKSTDSLRCRVKIGLRIYNNKRKFIGGQQKTSGNLVAKFLDFRVGECAAYTCRTKPKMNKFMYQGERPSRLRILVIDDDKRRYLVSQRESSKRFHVDCRVVASEISHQQNKNTD